MENNNDNFSANRDITLLHMIDALDYAAYISGIEGIRQVELEPVELGFKLYMTGFKIENGQPMVHIKHMNKMSEQPLLLVPDMDVWLNAAVMDEEMMVKGIGLLYKNMREATELYVLHLTYDKLVISPLTDKYTTVTDCAIYSNKRTACKDALAFRKKQQCKLKFTTIGTTTKHKITDLEFANAALE